MTPVGAWIGCGSGWFGSDLAVVDRGEASSGLIMSATFDALPANCDAKRRSGPLSGLPCLNGSAWLTVAMSGSEVPAGNGLKLNRNGST